MSQYQRRPLPLDWRAACSILPIGRRVVAAVIPRGVKDSGSSEVEPAGVETRRIQVALNPGASAPRRRGRDARSRRPGDRCGTARRRGPTRRVHRDRGADRAAHCETEPSLRRRQQANADGNTGLAAPPGSEEARGHSPAWTGAQRHRVSSVATASGARSSGSGTAPRTRERAQSSSSCGQRRMLLAAVAW